MSTENETTNDTAAAETSAAAENPTQGASGSDSTESPASSSSNAQSSTDASNPPAADSQTPPTAPAAPETPAAPTPVVPAGTLGLSKISSDFVDFLEKKVTPFLDIIDIPNVNDRRNAVIALGLKEEGMVEVITTARLVLKLQADFANSTENSDLITTADLYTGKLARMVEWLGF